MLSHLPPTHPLAIALRRVAPDESRVVRIEPRSYGGSITDAVFYFEDGSRRAAFTPLTPEEFDERMKEIGLPL